jgi:PAS domain S-box-containing protein
VGDEDHYRAAFDNVADAIVINVGTERVLMNQAFLTLHGLDDESQASGVPLDYFIIPEDRPSVRERTVARERGEPVPGVYEYRISRPDGRVRVVEASAVATTFQGQPATFTVLRDITERKEAEDELVRLGSIVESSHDGIICETLDGVITNWNAGAERIFGYPASEVEGQPVSVLVPPEVANDALDIVERIKTGEQVDHIETVCLRRDGSYVDVSLTMSPLKDTTGAIIGASTIARDITERKQAEEEERRHSQEMATLYSVANTLAQPGSFRERVTNVLERLVGLTRADQVALRVPDHRGQGLEAIAAAGPVVQENMRGLLPYAQGVAGAAFTQGEPVIVNDYRTSELASPEGVALGIESVASLPVKVAGRTIGVVNIISRDPNHFTTERIRLLNTIVGEVGVLLENARLYETLQERADELARSNADLEQFAYVASHDLQEPLRSVVGFTSLLSRRYEGKLDENADRFIGRAVAAASRMQVLINDLLSYSRVGRNLEDPEVIDVEALLAHEVDGLQAAIEESGADITYGQLPSIVADSSLMGQVFRNLIGNAIKFRGDEPPKVHVSAENLGNEWKFAVRDNGIGIDPQFAQRIFTIFQRLHTREDYPGTGIGLSICKKAVERLGGRIWVESQLGMGSTFYFTIPME